MPLVKPLCRVCERPTADGAVQAVQLDKEKLQTWLLNVCGYEFAEEIEDEDLICCFCIWHAEFLAKHECALDALAWWPQALVYLDDVAKELRRKYLEGKIEQCWVQLEKFELPESEKEENEEHEAKSDGQERKKKCFYCGKVVASITSHVINMHENAIRDPKTVRRGDKEDVINLERTFKQNRNCNFRSLLSPKKEVILQLLKDQDSLLRFFGSKDVIPSVFVLYILSHGDREATRARRNACGSTFAFLSCQVLDSLEKNEPVINVLTSVQLRVHRNLKSDFVFKESKYLGQTPEVKLFAYSRNFILYRSLNAPIASGSTSDGKGVILKKPAEDSIGEFFPWASTSGENMRHRRAFIFFTEFDHMVKGMIEGLIYLDFEVSYRTLNANNWELYVEEASSLPPNVGCIFTCFFAQVSETSDTNEVCVLMDSEEKKISEFLHGFIGPKNDKWIGKPKIFFILNQTETAMQNDYIFKKQNYSMSATNHSGWLVLVLHNKEKQQMLINILKGQELKRGICLQELLATLLISKENQDLLNTTLQFKLDFPDLPRSFVKLDFRLKTVEKNYPRETLDYKELLKMANPSKFGLEQDLMK
ncbi:Hypothetical predicted protein [Cloeon dipterum]|uniref:Uncharacterized protein n=1 Tax=Cloeon dipterum TaxID=197152 RepID=A0A8S1DP70_9INSE|nr:Hypothetical predicted protein [Cloeon dipterum]